MLVEDLEVKLTRSFFKFKLDRKCYLQNFLKTRVSKFSPKQYI